MIYSAHIWALHYVWFFVCFECSYRGEKNHTFDQIGQKWEFIFFLILYRNNYWGCCNQTFFGKTHTLTLLWEKFLWKMDKLICPPPLWNLVIFVIFFLNLLFYNTLRRVQRPKIENRPLTICSARAYLSSDIYMLGSLINSEAGKIKDISKGSKKH